MHKNSIEVLLVEDNLGDADLLEIILEEADASLFKLTHVERLSAVLERLQDVSFDVILLDLSLPDSQGLDTLMQVILTAPNIPIVVLTGCDDEQLGIQAVREGAQDYLLKGQLDGNQLIRALRYAIERKLSEAKILACLEQERELRELKSRFISMVSHEFRNPLTTIVASADLLEECSHLLTEDKKQHLHRRIQGAAQRMNQLLEDVLIVGSAEASGEAFQPEFIDLKDFCSELVEEFQFSNDNQHAIAFIAPEFYPDVLLDRKLLLQILSNLLSNAIKYSPPGTRVQLELICEPTVVIFHIRDEGIGIHPEDIERLFTAFHRGKNTHGISGTGLGLAIVKRAVDLHGGQVSVESQLNIGTTFTVTLPIK